VLRVDRRWMPTLALLTFASAKDSTAQQGVSLCPGLALTPGRLLRVEAPAPLDTSHASVVGPLVRCTNEQIVLGAYPGQEDSAYVVRTRWLRRLWVRDDARRPGLIAGSVAGAVTFGSLAALRSELCTRGQPPVSTTCSGPWFRDAVIGAAVGGLVGWVLGSGLPRWRRIWP